MGSPSCSWTRPSSSWPGITQMPFKNWFNCPNIKIVKFLIRSPYNRLPLRKFPIEQVPVPLLVNPGYFRVFLKVSKQQQINCLPSRFLMTTLYIVPFCSKVHFQKISYITLYKVFLTSSSLMIKLVSKIFQRITPKVHSE